MTLLTPRRTFSYLFVILLSHHIARAEQPHHWCRTHEHWALRNPPPESGACPIEGECDIPAIRDSWIPNPFTPVVTLRMRFVVFAEDDGQNPAATPQQVTAQIEQLNADLLPSGFRFVATTDYVNSTQFRYFAPGEETPMKLAYAQFPDQQLNVYLVANSGGYSVGTFPWDPNALTAIGGIVLNQAHFGPSRSILTHEVGHNIGLWHTHHGVSEVSSCSPCYERADHMDADTTGDFAGDTPPTPVNFNCAPPGGSDPCSSTPWGMTDVGDYMGYAPDSCYTHFSQHQKGRQRCWYNQVLTSWRCLECEVTGACCHQDSPGVFSCTDVLQDACDGAFFGPGTRCDKLPPGDDRCDCNHNDVVDILDIAQHTSDDCNTNVVPDECEPDTDCNNNSQRDICDIAAGTSLDCNDNNTPDECDLASGASPDCDENNVPDDCQPDCNLNHIADVCDITSGESTDADDNGVPDECQIDLYVAADAPGLNIGNTWSDAYHDLQDALAAAHRGDRIHVAQGVYKPSHLPLRTSTFQLPIGVALYGGYAGPGTINPDARDPNLYPTILSGDLAGNDKPDFGDVTDNAYNIVSSHDADAATILDGFTITAGNADGSFLPYDAGGAIRIEAGTPRISNCRFEGNQGRFGGAMECFNGANPTVTHCTFANNRSLFRGGAVHVNGSAPRLTHCLFIVNDADNSGGAMRSLDGAPMVTNCRFIGNTALFGGAVVNDDSDSRFFGCLFSGNAALETSGAMHNWTSNPSIDNCTFSSNVAGAFGGGLYNTNASHPAISNTIFWTNQDQTGMTAGAQITSVDSSACTVNYTCIQGGWTEPGGVGNIDVDPLFIDANGKDNIVGTLDDDAHLYRGSPCKDAGHSAESTPPDDLDGHTRILCDDIDMGSLEFGIGDADCDGYVTATDFIEWAPCQTPPGGPIDMQCASFDFDADGEVNVIDYGGFQSAFDYPCSISLTMQPVDTTVCGDDPVAALQVAAQGDGVTYQWRRFGLDLPGATAPNLDITAPTPDDSGAYLCVVAAACGNAVFSDSAQLTVTDPPTEFVTQPIGGEFCTGGVIFMFVSATNFPALQWYKDDQPIPDATSSFLIIGDITPADAGQYHAVGANNCNTATSDIVTVTVVDCTRPENP